MDFCEWDLIDHHWAESVEEYLKRSKESLAKYSVQKDGFEFGRQIGVEAVDPECFVMGEMIRLHGASLAMASARRGIDIP